MRLATSAGVLSGLPMYIDDTASVTVQQIKAKLRRMKNLGLVVIDYLQLMGSTLRTDNRVLIISEITRQLKIMNTSSKFILEHKPSAGSFCKGRTGLLRR